MKSKKMNVVCIMLAVLLIVVSGLYINEKLTDSKSEEAVSTNVTNQENKEDSATESEEETTTTNQEKVDYSDFLNSEQGWAFKSKCFEFLKSYLAGDEAYIKSSLVKQEDIYAYGHTFDQLQYMEFRFINYDEATKTANADYILEPESEDSFDYLDLTLQLIDGEWKVLSYGLEK
ncbi:hypothetical protein [Anaerosporobacter sp.]